MLRMSSDVDTIVDNPADNEEEENNFDNGDFNFVFEIPERDDDLLMENTETYYVQSVLPEDVCTVQLNEFNSKYSDSVDTDRWILLLEYFPAFFSLSRSCSIFDIDSQDNWKIRLTALQHLLQCNKVLYPSVVYAIKNYLESDCTSERKASNKVLQVRNGVLMIIYLFGRLIHLLENEYIKRSKAQIKKGRARVELDAEMTRYVKLRPEVIDACIDYLDISVFDREGKKRLGALHYLWRTGKIDPSLTRVLTDIVLKLLEHPSNIFVSSKPWLIHVFKLCRAICIRSDCYHRMAAALIEKSCQLEYLKDSANAHQYPFIDPIIGASLNNDMDVLISHMLNVVAQFEHQDNVQQIRPVSSFLQAVAEKAANVLVKHLTSLATYLEKDPHQLRTAALSAFAEMISSSTLSDENCQNYSRLAKARERMFEKLLNHLIDQNAMVRQKSVQLFSKIAERNCIPLDLYKECILKRLGKRLLDKSVNVRKAAVHFLSAFLVHNPFGHDFSYDVHIRELVALLKKREELRKENPEFAEVGNAERRFEEKSEEIISNLKIWLESHKNKDEGAFEDLSDGVDLTQLYCAALLQINTNPAASAKILIQLIITGKLSSLQIPEEFEVDETAVWLCRELKEAYVRLVVTSQQQDNAILLENEERNEDYHNKVVKINQNIAALKEKLLVELELEEAIPLALRAVIHGDNAEMKEGIKFVVECKNFMISGADKAVRILCSLVWRQNNEITKEVVDAASRMFISVNKNKEIQQVSTAENLLRVVEGMQEEERGCVEEVLSLLAQGSLTAPIYDKIWDEFNRAQGKKKLVPMRLLAILTRAGKNELRKRLRNFQAVIRDPEMDSEVRSECLLAIANLGSERSDDDSEAFRIPATDSLFSTLETFLNYELLRVSANTEWFKVMHSCVRIYFNMAKDTSAIVGKVMAKAMWYNKRLSEWVLFYENAATEETDPIKLNRIEELKNHYKRMFTLTTERVLSMCGEIAFRCMIFTDITFYREARRLASIIHRYRSGDISAAAPPERPLKDFEHRCASRRGLFDFSCDKIEGSGTTDEERVRMRSDKILEYRVWRNGRLLSRLLPYVVYCLRAESSPPAVRNAAALAFSKFMLASRDLSEKGAKVFFSCLNNSEWPTLRNNLMVAAGDLVFRSPNMVEKFAGDLFSMTTDKNTAVRETAILVLSHITKNQMLKMRGSLADVARCYLDDSPVIRDLTREFFVSLNKKGSYVYNMMPDFISRLSRNNHEINLNEFKEIMGQLMDMVKDKHPETLIEKLCQRFDYAKTNEGLAQNKHLPYYFSFCVSKVVLNDKSLYKMRDCLPHYAMFLKDKQILNDFLTCLQPIIKATKSIDVKHDAEDFEKQLRCIHEQGQRPEDMERTKKARNTPKRALKSKSRVPTKKPKTVRFSDSEDD